MSSAEMSTTALEIVLLIPGGIAIAILIDFVKSLFSSPIVGLSEHWDKNSDNDAAHTINSLYFIVSPSKN
jgi:hypothetical protein